MSKSNSAKNNNFKPYYIAIAILTFILSALIIKLNAKQS